MPGNDTNKKKKTQNAAKLSQENRNHNSDTDIEILYWIQINAQSIFHLCLWPRFLLSFFSLRVTSSYFCFNLLHAVDECGHRLRRRRIRNDDVADVKRTESGFCRNNKNGRKGEKVNVGARVCTVNGRMAARFMLQKKINDMLNGNKSQCQHGTGESQANNKQNHLCIQISFRAEYAFGAILLL